MKQLNIIRASVLALAIGFVSSKAHAAEAGHPGVSSKGATTSQTQLKLICDPVGATNGSISTSFTPYVDGYSVATLTEVDPLNGYEVTNVEVQIANPQLDTSWYSFTPASPGQNVPITITMPDSMHETGQVQVFWQLAPDQTPPEGEDNIFQELFNTPNSSNPNLMGKTTLMNYLDPGSTSGGMSQTPDFYSGMMMDSTGNEVPFTYADDPNFMTDNPSQANDPGLDVVPMSDVATDVVTLPEPSSIAFGGLMCMVGLLRRHRR